MGKSKKKETPVEEPVEAPKKIISTLKKPLIEKKQENPKTDLAVPVSKKEGAGSFARDDRQHFKVSDFTGKDRQRLWEWVKFRTQIKVKLINGDIYQGYLRWYDQFSVKLITATEEIVIPKHSVLCYFDAPKPKRGEASPEAVAAEKDT